jgi:hypothetical protein
LNNNNNNNNKVLQRDELAQEETTGIIPHSRQAGNPFEMQQTWGI